MLQLDSLSKDDLIKLIKKYVILQKQLKTKNEELTNKLNEKTEHAPLANATSTDDLLEQEKFKVSSTVPQFGTVSLMALKLDPNGV